MDTLTTRDIARELGCSEPTARRFLGRLHARGIATLQRTPGRSTYAITRAAFLAVTARDADEASECH